MRADIILLSLTRSQAPAWERTASQAPPAGRDREAERPRQGVPRQKPGNKLHSRGWRPRVSAASTSWLLASYWPVASLIELAMVPKV